MVERHLIEMSFSGPGKLPHGTAHASKGGGPHKTTAQKQIFFYYASVVIALSTTELFILFPLAKGVGIDLNIVRLDSA